MEVQVLMRMSRDKLEFELREVLNDIRHDKNIINKVNGILSNNNVKIGFLNELLVRDIIEEIDTLLLCILSISLYTVLGQERINPEVYFNPPEMDKAKQYQGEEDFEEITFPIVLENVIRVGSSEKDFCTSMPVQLIAQWDKSKILNYNHDTQRSPMQTLVRGEIIKRPKVNYRSVNQISNLMIRGKYKPDKISLNILFDGNDEIEYDDKNNTLTIYKCTQIDILDGFHRDLGLIKALETNPNIDLSLEVAIKNYTTSEAKEYFAQINTINRVSSQRLKQLRNDRISDQIVTELEKTEEFKLKISSEDKVSGRFGELTTFITLSDAIDQVFKPKTRKDLIDLSAHLLDFFGYMFGTFPDEFKNKIIEVREKSWINHPNIFPGYIVLAKKFLDQKINVSKIAEVMSSIDFNLKTSDLSEILKLTAKKKVESMIIEYFNQIEI
jgi:hypothetical protein